MFCSKSSKLLRSKDSPAVFSRVNQDWIRNGEFTPPDGRVRKLAKGIFDNRGGGYIAKTTLIQNRDHVQSQICILVARGKESYLCSFCGFEAQYFIFFFYFAVTTIWLSWTWLRNYLVLDAQFRASG